MDAAALKQLTDGGIVSVLIVLALWWTRVGHPRLMRTLDRYAETAEVQRKESIEAQVAQRKEYLASQEAQRKEFQAALTAQQAMFLAQLGEQRKDHLDTIRMMREHSSSDAAECSKERKAMSQAFREEREADRLARQQDRAEFQQILAGAYNRGADDQR